MFVELQASATHHGDSTSYIAKLYVRVAERGNPIVSGKLHASESGWRMLRRIVEMGSRAVGIEPRISVRYRGNLNSVSATKPAKPLTNPTATANSTRSAQLRSPATNDRAGLSATSPDPAPPQHA